MTTLTDHREPLQVTIQEAARLLSYDPRTVRRKIDNGELKATGHGRGRRVIMASIKRLLDTQTR